MKKNPTVLLGRLCLLIALQAGEGAIVAAPVLHPTHSQQVRPSAILPPAFRGHWSEDMSECGTDAVEDDQVWITGSALNYYETAEHLTHVVLQGRRAVADVRVEDEGRAFASKVVLTLSPDGKSLTLRDERRPGDTRFHRCPIKPVAASR